MCHKGMVGTIFSRDAFPGVLYAQPVAIWKMVPSVQITLMPKYFGPGFQTKAFKDICDILACCMFQ